MWTLERLYGAKNMTHLLLVLRVRYGKHTNSEINIMKNLCMKDYNGHNVVDWALKQDDITQTHLQSIANKIWTENEVVADSIEMKQLEENAHHDYCNDMRVSLVSSLKTGIENNDFKHVFNVVNAEDYFVAETLGVFDGIHSTMKKHHSCTR